MERLGHEHHSDTDKRTARPIEQFKLESRIEIERKYKEDPKGYHARLIYQGFWRVAAQLKTDYEAGRL